MGRLPDRGHVAGGEATLRTRKGQDYTERFANVAKELVKAVKTPDCVVDGEVCALDEDGRPSFSAMQQGKPGTPIVYFVFDLLEVEGEPLVDLPLEERRKRLEGCSTSGTGRSASRRPSTTASAARGGEAAGARGDHGQAPGLGYLPGRRSRDWLKVKTHGRQEFVIAGYTRGTGPAPGHARLARARAYEGGDLDYAGNVGTGFSDGEIDGCWTS